MEENSLRPEPPEFVAYRKIPRLNRDITISEKIDGTNAVLNITEDGWIHVGSRTRWISPGKKTDNHGFAAWVEDHHKELLLLGPGFHFGEWYGSGINRGYGLLRGEKRLALFRDYEELPSCVKVTPRIYEGPFDMYWIQRTLTLLKEQGSYAVPGYMNPEGIVVFHHASRHLYKATILNDDAPKGILK